MRTLLVFLVAMNGWLLACRPLARAQESTETVNVLAASYSYGGDFADVTVRVKNLLAEGKNFQANPGCLLVDPHPGWNKALVIFCEVRGKRSIFSVGENEDVSNERMLAKARPVAEATQSDAFTFKTPGKHSFFVIRGSERIKVEGDFKLQPGDTVEVAQSVW